MEKNKKILFMVPDGVGVRNYLYSDLITKLVKENYSIVLLSNLPKSLVKELENLHQCNIENYPLTIYKENFTTRILRESTSYARLLHNSKITNNKTILSNWIYSPESLQLKILNFICQIIGFFVSFNYQFILILEKIAINKWNKTNVREAENIIKKIIPNKIFITHQRVAGIMPYCIAAKNLNITSFTVIYSWDNLPKARLAVQTDYYLVWSMYMKEEMKMYYKEISPEKVIIAGTPQFEFYKNKDNIFDKNEFYLKYNLDKNKKIVCFSGDDVTTSPDDPKYLEDVAQNLIENGLDSKYQIIFRKCPVDISNRYNYVLNKYNFIIKEANPIWESDNDNFNLIFPDFKDIKLLVSTVFYSDIVINVGSSMAFDFASYNKSCIYINYDQKNKNTKNWSIKLIYAFQHFKSMPTKDSILWLNKIDDLSNLLNKKQNIQPLIKWKDLIINKNENSTDLIVNILKKTN